MTAVDEATGPVATLRSERPDPGRPRRLGVPAWESWLAAVPVVVLVVQGWQRRWMADDGLIHLRVVQNVLGGHGLVFNAGERVEASTSALWVALLAVLRAPRLVGLETLAVVTGLAATAAGLVLAIGGARILWRRPGERSCLLPAGALVLAVLPPMWDFATSGLETGLVFLWLGASFHFLAGLAAEAVPGRRRWPLTAAVIGAGPLIRPDLALCSAAFLAALLFVAYRSGGHRPARRLAGLVAAALLLPCAFQLFRMGYYGALVPTTALAKEASRSWWGQGKLYLEDFLGTYWLAVPFSIAAVLAVARGRAAIRDRATTRLVVATAPVVGGLADALYVTRVGGDFMHARMLLPGLFAVLMPVAVVEAGAWWRKAAVALLVPWAVVCAAQLRVRYVVGPHGIADERSFYAISSGHKNPVQVQDYARTILFADGEAALRSKAQPEPQLVWRTAPNKPEYASMPLRAGFPFHTAYAASNLGITGVMVGPSVHIIDHSGLADPLASRLQLAARGRPGHEKGLPLPWIIARFGDPGAAIPAGVAPADVDAARRALDCGPLRELQAATNDRLTVGQFARNVRLSIRLRNFRFPPDPATAEARVCRR